MLEEFKAEIIKQLELALDDETLRHAPELAEALRYSVFPPGKCLRPLLACALTQDLGGDGLALAHVAAGLELIHVSTLIHDDLPEMDNDLYRRGRASTHAKFGSATALLAGNYLAARALQWVFQAHSISQEAKIQIGAIFTRALCAVNIGQQRDISLQEEKEITDQLKTGALFAASAELAGIILTGAGKDFSQHELHSFGILVGILFQQQDDRFDSQNEKTADNSFPQKIFDNLQEKKTGQCLLGFLPDLVRCDLVQSESSLWRQDPTSFTYRVLTEAFAMQ
jgi:geranylgeranyl diphosphate synthase type II